MKRKLQLGAGLLVSLLFVALSLRGRDLPAIARALSAANYAYLVPYFAILLAIHVVRTVRWGMLIAPLRKIPFRRLNAVCAVGFMALVVLPFRIGELGRPYLVREKGGLSGTAALASVVVERVLDGIVVALMLVLLLLRVSGSGREIAWVRAGGWAMFGFFAGLLAFLLLAWWQQDLALRLTRATFGRLSTKLGEKLASTLETFLSGLRALPSWKSLAGIVAWTAVYWGINGWGMQILAQGFGIHLSLVQAYTVLGVLVIGVMIPAGPGMAGTFQYFTQLGLALFLAGGLTSARAAAYANVLWAAQFVQQVGLGLVFLFSRDLARGRHVTLGELMHAEEAMGEGGAASSREGTVGGF